MHLKLVAPLALVLTATAVLAGFSWVSYQADRDVVAWAEKRELEQVRTLISTSLQAKAREAAAQAELVAALPPVRDAFGQQDRAALSALMAPVFRQLNVRHDLEAASFVRPPAQMFLRLHAPLQHGDDVSNIRPLLVNANRSREVQSGLELSASRLGLRGVAPVAGGAGHAGVFEVNFGLAGLAADIRLATGYDIAVLVNSGLLPQTAAGSERQAGLLTSVESTDWKLVRAVLGDAEGLRTSETSFLERQVDGRGYAVVTVPLFDFSGRNVGVIAAVKETVQFTRQLSQTGVRLAVATILGILVIAVAARLVVAGMVLRPVEELTDRLRALSEGDYGTRVPHAGKGGEIGRLGGTMNSLRQALIQDGPATAKAKAE